MRSRSYLSDAASHCGAAHGGEVLGEALDAPPLDRVPVGHRTGRNTVRGQLIHRVEEILKVGAVLESGNGRALDGRAVHTRIRVREAEFDDVNSAVRQDLTRTDRVLNRRKAHGQVGDERSVAALEGGVNRDG